MMTIWPTEKKETELDIESQATTIYNYNMPYFKGRLCILQNNDIKIEIL
jgi:hypothetical protein